MRSTSRSTEKKNDAIVAAQEHTQTVMMMMMFEKATVHVCCVHAVHSTATGRERSSQQQMERCGRRSWSVCVSMGVEWPQPFQVVCAD